MYQYKEIEVFAKKFYQKTTPTLDGLSSILKPSLERYEALENKQKDEFKSLLHSFNRLYAFIIQVCRMFDKDMQKLYVFTKYLTKVLPKTIRRKLILMMNYCLNIINYRKLLMEK